MGVSWQPPIVNFNFLWTFQPFFTNLFAGEDGAGFWRNNKSRRFKAYLHTHPALCAFNIYLWGAETIAILCESATLFGQDGGWVFLERSRPPQSCPNLPYGAEYNKIACQGKHVIIETCSRRDHRNLVQIRPVGRIWTRLRSFRHYLLALKCNFVPPCIRHLRGESETT